jgi:hypothetical protein
MELAISRSYFLPRFLQSLRRFLALFRGLSRPMLRRLDPVSLSLDLLPPVLSVQCQLPFCLTLTCRDELRPSEKSQHDERQQSG